MQTNRILSRIHHNFTWYHKYSKYSVPFKLIANDTYFKDHESSKPIVNDTNSKAAHVLNNKVPQCMI